MAMADQVGMAGEEVEAMAAVADPNVKRYYRRPKMCAIWQGGAASLVIQADCYSVLAQ